LLTYAVSVERTLVSMNRSRPGGRSKRIVDAVLRSTIEQLAVDGWAALRIDAVAARAGVHKTTIYRRWPTRGALVAAALAATPFRTLGATSPDTGSLSGDVRALVDDFARVWAEPRTRAVARTLTAARDDPEVAEVWSGYWRAQIDRVRPIIQRGVERGEAEPGVDPDFVAEMYLGTGFLHVVELQRDLTQPWTDLLVDAVVSACQLPGPRPARR
jgi:AcrR family transcriptional regulator